MAGISVEIKGLDALEKKLASPLAGGPARNFLTRGAILVQNGGREFAPVDRGTLRNSITYEVEGGAFPHWARIGPNISVGGGGGTDNYAEAQEFGTAPFTPPLAPLEAWGARKGDPGLGVAAWKAIRERGIIAKHYLQQGADQAAPKIDDLVPVLAHEIEVAFAIGGE